MIQNFSDFVDVMMNAGFSMGGGQTDGIYCAIPHSWQENPDGPIQWHTECPETDPWEWRMRVLDERDDIAYAKMFFKKSGYITKEWYPYFLAARRDGAAFEDAYEAGKVSHNAKRIYDAVSAAGMLAVPDIKRAACFGGDDKAAFDKALVELQMGLFLTMCGRKHNPTNGNWSATVFCTTEHFWGGDVFAQAAKTTKEEASEKIRAQIKHLNPDADDKKIKKFIFG
ncbi:MAG: hypothetical protein FWE21_01755 [Defluviitaleaceae bacterium]|nr:hypothetical protein [Defluviitaleaceae bacterium]